MKTFDIYGIGNALLDMLFEVDDAWLADNNIDKGVMTLIDEAQHTQLFQSLQSKQHSYACGGSAANTIITAQELGAKTFYSCRVANERIGTLYYHDMITKEIHTNLTETNRPEGITGTCIVLITPDGERTMLTHLGITETIAQDVICEQSLAASRFAYIEGYLSAQEQGTQAAIKVREVAEKNDVKTAITLSDPNIVMYCKDNLKAMIGDGVDLLFCNEKEALLFCEVETIEEAIANLRSYAKQFVITRGQHGALVSNHTEHFIVSGHPANVIDTVGAGDTFAGTYLYSIVKGFDLHKATTFANRTASAVVEKLGPRLTASELSTIASVI